MRTSPLPPALLVLRCEPFDRDFFVYIFHHLFIGKKEECPSVFLCFPPLTLLLSLSLSLSLSFTHTHTLSLSLSLSLPLSLSSVLMSSGDGTPPPLRSRTNSFASKLGFRSSRTKSDCPEVVRPIVVPSLGDSFSSFASAPESPRAGHSPRVSDSPRPSFPSSPPPPKPSQTPSPPVSDATNRRPPPPPAAPKPLLRGSPVPGVRSGSSIISTPRRMSNPPGDSENLIDQVVASSPPSHRASSSAPRSVTVHFPSNEEAR